VQVNNGRVPVEEDGGYLLEVDGFATGEPVYFRSNQGLLITIKHPDDDEITSDQKTYIRNFINSFESRLFSSNFQDPEEGYRKMVDEQSLINWYIASELTGNSDAFWSIFIYKYKDKDKLYFGPLWDFDIAFNNDNRLGDAVKKLMRSAAHDPKTWIRQLWKDKWFRESVSTRWKELVSEGNIEQEMLKYITDITTEIDASQKKNFEKWPNLNRRVYNETFLFQTYQEGVDYLSRYVSERVAFLTESFGDFTTFTPEEQSTYYIANIRTKNRITVPENTPEEGDVKLELWNPFEEEEDQNQQWIFVPLQTGFQILDRNSGLAVTGNGRGSNLILQDPNENYTRQQWQIIPIGNGAYGIVNNYSSYSVNNSSGNTVNRTPAIEYDNRIEESQNQQWVITKATDFGETGCRFISMDEQIKIHPNYSQNRVEISFSQPGSTNVQVRIYGIDGKNLYDKKFGMDGGMVAVPFDAIRLKSGMYIINVKVGDNSHTERLIFY